MKRDQRTYLAWLSNAYGQEMAMVKMYRMHAKDASAGLNDFPELAKFLEQKAKQSEKHARLIDSCLVRHEIKPNGAKIALGKTMGVLLGWTGDVTIDKVIMNDLTDLGLANFEVGAYLTLIAAAKAMNDQETATVCQQILQDERATAQWLESITPKIAQDFLSRTAR